MNYRLLFKGAVAEGSSIGHHCHIAKHFMEEIRSLPGTIFHHFQWELGWGYDYLSLLKRCGSSRKSPVNQAVLGSSLSVVFLILSCCRTWRTRICLCNNNDSQLLDKKLQLLRLFCWKEELALVSPWVCSANIKMRPCEEGSHSTLLLFFSKVLRVPASISNGNWAKLNNSQHCGSPAFEFTENIIMICLNYSGNCGCPMLGRV